VAFHHTNITLRPRRKTMRHGRIRCASLLAGIGLLCGACANGSGPQVPPTPDQAWAPPQLGAYENQLSQQASQYTSNAGRVAIDPKRVYTLPELIDIAERNNPETRIAWERARQAAAGVGLAQSTFYPYLAASAGAGYSKIFLPFPTLAVDQRPLVTQLINEVPTAASNPLGALHTIETKNLNINAPPVSITGGGTLVLDSVASNEALSVKWLLIDFGERHDLAEAARQNLMMADVGFNAAHQKLVFDVTRSFYTLGDARQQVRVAVDALKAAQTVEEAVKAKLDNGLAIKPEYLQARQQSAQWEFQLDAAQGAESDAQVALVDTLGLLPTTPVQIADDSGKPLPSVPERSVDQLIILALSQRPDLVAKLAELKAKQSEVRAAQADFYPKIAVTGNVGDATLNTSFAGSDYVGGQHSVYGAAVSVDLPIFDGGERIQKLKIAEADLRAAESEMADARDSAVREVWQAYTDFRTALREQEAATRLVTAAQNSYDAVIDSYRNGLSTYVEVVDAERDLTAAQSTNYKTRSTIFTSAAALAFSVGNLARPANINTTSTAASTR
jgi:outer membrane protein